MIIKLEQIKINAHLTKHYSYEKSELQDIFINISVEIANDNLTSLDKTIDYAKLEFDIIDLIKSKQFVVIEQVANEVADLILTNNLAIKTTVEVGKDNVMQYSKTASVAITKDNGYKVFIALGSNLGDKIFNIQNAITKLQKHIKIIKTSSMYESEALLPPNSPPEWNIPYMNAVFYGYTKLNPFDLLSICQSIEHGKNTEKWAPRELDIDIIWYDNKIVINDNLTIPHIEFLKRDFVIKPMFEIAPEMFIHSV